MPPAGWAMLGTTDEMVGRSSTPVRSRIRSRIRSQSWRNRALRSESESELGLNQTELGSWDIWRRWSLGEPQGEDGDVEDGEARGWGREDLPVEGGVAYLRDEGQRVCQCQACSSRQTAMCGARTCDSPRLGTPAVARHEQHKLAGMGTERGGRDKKVAHPREDRRDARRGLLARPAPTIQEGSMSCGITILQRRGSRGLARPPLQATSTGRRARGQSAAGRAGRWRTCEAPRGPPRRSSRPSRPSSAQSHTPVGGGGGAL